MAEDNAPNGFHQPLKYQRTSNQPENPFSALIPDQEIAIVPSFTLESGEVLRNVPVAYSRRGKLSSKGDNAIVICHALSGSADVSDWWGPLLGGPGRAFDVTRFFVICLNSLGSPYGSASPVTNVGGDPKRGQYGPEFPLTTIRDDVNLHKLVLDELGVRQLAAVVGGSMGGMLALEYAFFGRDYVRTIVPIATSSRHSAWGIAWGESQRQAIYCDPKYQDGYYPTADPPSAGLGAARMSALLTYRTKDSFESRFGRNTPDPSKRQPINDNIQLSAPPNEHWVIHNDGHMSARPSRRASINGESSVPNTQADGGVATRNGHHSQFTDPQFNGTTIFDVPTPPTPPSERKRVATSFSAQSYLRYQGQKFVKRFDPNCYIAITRKLDTHDVSRYRVPPDTQNPVAAALAQIQQPTLVLGIASDGLFTYAEQQEIADGIPNSRLKTIVNSYILEFFREVLPEFMRQSPSEDGSADRDSADIVGEITKSSTFGEAEADDLTAW